MDASIAAWMLAINAASSVGSRRIDIALDSSNRKSSIPDHDLHPAPARSDFLDQLERGGIGHLWIPAVPAGAFSVYSLGAYGFVEP